MQLAKDFLSFLRSVPRNGYMIRTMIRRDIRSRFVGSFLGVFWSVVHPLSQFVIYYFVFSVIVKIRIGAEYAGTDFAVWLIAGMLPWLFFAEVVNRSPDAVLDQASLISRTMFPSEILPLAQLGAALINHFVALSVFATFLLLFGGGLSVRVLWLFPTMAAVALLALGLAWLLAALNVFLRDIGQVVGVFVHIWFFLTPIMYPQQMIPTKLHGVYSLNPMLHAVEGYRVALLGKTQLDLEHLPYLVVPGLLAFALGGLVFKKLKPAFADVL